MSCGCFGREQNALALSRLRKLFVETGQRFGRGVVIDPEIRVRHSNGRAVRHARLRCDCGSIYEVALEIS